MKTPRDPANPAYTGSMADSHHEGPDPREFFRLLWRRKVLILLCLTLIPLAAYAYSERLTKTYQASTTISVQGTATDAGLFLGSDSSTGSASPAQVAALVGTDSVSDQASRLLGEPRGSLRGAASGAEDEETGFINITATAGSGERAAEIPNAFARALKMTRGRAGVARIDVAIGKVQKELDKLPPGDVEQTQLSEQLQTLRTLRAAQSENLQVVQPAAAPAAPLSPNPKRNTI